MALRKRTTARAQAQRQLDEVRAAMTRGERPSADGHLTAARALLTIAQTYRVPLFSDSPRPSLLVQALTETKLGVTADNLRTPAVQQLFEDLAGEISTIPTDAPVLEARLDEIRRGAARDLER